jgi:Protein of unknown function (DUF1579)
MNVRVSILSSLCAALLAGAATARQSAPPSPGPEVKKLEAFAGKWKGEAEMKPGPSGPGGKIASESECTWYDGGWQLVCRENGSGFMGKFKSEYVLGWSPEEKVYKYAGHDSMGQMGWATGSVSSNTWTWNSTDKMNGKTIHSRYTVTLDTPKSQSFRYETSEDGRSWTVAAEGKSNKQ